MSGSLGARRATPAVLLVIAAVMVALIVLPTGAGTGPADGGISLGGLSRAGLWIVAWGTAAVLVAATAGGLKVEPRALVIAAVATALVLVRMPVVVGGVLLLAASTVPRLSPGSATAGWARTLVVGSAAGFGTAAAVVAAGRHGDDLLAVVLVLGFLATLGAVPFGWHLVHWLEEAPAAAGALVAAVLLPAMVTALFAAEPALAQVRGTQRAGFLLGVFGGATAIAGALYSTGARDWRELALRTAPGEVGLALVGVAAFDIRGLQAAALTLAVLAVTRPVLVFAEALGPRRGAGLVMTALALVASAGLPPTMGFAARQLVLSAAVRVHPLVAVLAVAGVLLEITALAVVLRRRLAQPGSETPPPRRLPAALLAGATALALVSGGVFPGVLLRFVFRLGAG